MFLCIQLLLAFEENGVRAYYSPELLIFRMSACHIICAGQQQGYRVVNLGRNGHAAATSSFSLEF
jgi:hypothetical protein